MDDLGDPFRCEAEFFRYVEGPQHVVNPPSGPSTPSAAKMLAASARFGCAFAALRNTISVYSLADVRKEEPAKPTARVTLPHATSAVGLKLVLSDEGMVVQVQEPEQGKCMKLWLIDVKDLLQGNFSQLSFGPANRGPFRTCTTYSPHHVLSRPLNGNTKDLLAAVTAERKVEVFELSSDHDNLLWSSEDDVPESQAPTSIALSPDGFMLAVGTMRGSIRVCDAKTGAEMNVVKEVESGWFPSSLSFLANDSLLVCYQNDNSMLNHVVWQLETAPVTCSVVGELFFPPLEADDPDATPNPMAMMCEPVAGWNVSPIANTTSSELFVLARQEDRTWAEWDLDEGKRAALPLPTNSDGESLPLGIAMDYTDMTPIPSLREGEPARNPMPRLLILTSEEVLMSFSLVDDRPGAKCKAVSPEGRNSSGAPQLRRKAFVDVKVDLKPSVQEKKPFAFEKSSGFPASSASPQTIADAFNIAVPDTTVSTVSVDTSAPAVKGAVPESTPAFGMSNLFKNPVQSELGNRDMFSVGAFEVATPESKNQFLSTFSFPESQVSEPERRLEPVQQQVTTTFGNSETQVATFNVPAANISASLAAAGNDDPAEQIRSILLEMREELNSARVSSAGTAASVLETKENIEGNLRTAERDLSFLLSAARECFAKQNDTREDVNDALQQVLENGYNFEDLSLLATLLTDQNDSRPLPRDIVEVDKKLAKKEAEIANSLNRIEDKLEEPIDGGASEASRRQWRTHAQVTQHIYSSLSLQSIRIKRVKALLNALSKQIEGTTLSQNEKRVTNLGLSLSRLERLSLGTSSSKGPKSSPAKKSNARQASNGEAHVKSETSRGDPGSSYESAAIGAESASMLRRLAMRKGRSKIVVSPLAPVTNNSAGMRRSGSSQRQQAKVDIPAAPAPNDPLHSIGNIYVSEPDQRQADVRRPIMPANSTGFGVPASQKEPVSFSLFSGPNFKAPVPAAAANTQKAGIPVSRIGTNGGNMPSLFANAATTNNPIVFNATGASNVPLSIGPGLAAPAVSSSIFNASTTLPDEASAESSSKSKVQFASLPRSDEPPSVEDSGKEAALSSSSSYAMTKTASSVAAQTAFMPPDDSAFEEVSQAKVPGVVSKAPAPPPVAAAQTAFMPPDDSAFEEVSQANVPGVTTAPAPPSIPESSSSIATPSIDSSPFPSSSALPPKPSPAKSFGSALPASVGASAADGKKNEDNPSENLATGSLFAALPPDEAPKDDVGGPKNSPTVSVPALQSTPGSGSAQSNSLFGALPPAGKIEDKGAFLPPNVPSAGSSDKNAGFPQNVPETSAFRSSGMMNSDTSSDEDNSNRMSTRMEVPANVGNSGASPFGNAGGTGSLFGNSSASTAATPGSLFGNQSGSGFGGNPVGWGSANNSSPSSSLFAAKPSTLFGNLPAQPAAASAPSPFGQFGGGQSQALTPQPSTGMQNSASALMSPPAAAFGASSTFGNPSPIGMSSTFGAPSAIGGSSFGNPSALGASSAFGAPSALGGGNASPFGGTSQMQSAPLFGSQSSSASGFAALAQSAGGGFGGFGSAGGQGFGGQQAASPFNQAAVAPPVFGGQPQNQSGFGSAQPSGFTNLAGSGGGFGQQTQSQPQNFKSAAFTQRRA